MCSDQHGRDPATEDLCGPERNVVRRGHAFFDKKWLLPDIEIVK
jgi:hypothetical protein